MQTMYQKGEGRQQFAAIKCINGDLDNGLSSLSLTSTEDAYEDKPKKIETDPNIRVNRGRVLNLIFPKSKTFALKSEMVMYRGIPGLRLSGGGEYSLWLIPENAADGIKLNKAFPPRMKTAIQVDFLPDGVRLSPQLQAVPVQVAANTGGGESVAELTDACVLAGKDVPAGATVDELKAILAEK